MNEHRPARRTPGRAVASTFGVLVGAGALVATSLAGSAVASPASGPGSQDEPLSIMLTNDDGWDAPGITAVYDALVASGHSVTLVAPAANQSGSGARTTYSGALAVGQPEPGKYWVEGSPADAAEFGLSTVFADEAPDLVISGSNTGQNIGAASITSGTVGAAATALNEGVPAIAVSTERAPDGGGPYAETADFVVDLVDSLDEHSKKGAILPTGVGLNVNYPIVDDGGEPEGVEITSTGTGFVDVEHSGGSLPEVGEETTFDIATTMTSETVKGADTTALDEDKVAVTVITGNYDASPGTVGPVRSAIETLG
ncbi:5'/3'-nucleotidase SurE [Brachybacterium sp. YJGR34]|uniref:5'/3'-nucleotidase SurE n=1 Tax=Brachybacterium sp. YJGR34 TaxID=2059911 RepID=UPI000E0B5A6F|nr:5'/3'-nucleotidase SurE [Brachybacterium sp. YJGR34]